MYVIYVSHKQWCHITVTVLHSPQYRTAERKYLQWLCTNQLEVLHPARMKSLTAFRALLINILILAMEEHKKSAALWSFLSSFSLLSFFYSTLTIFSRLMNFISNEQLLSEKKSFDKTYSTAQHRIKHSECIFLGS